jgi:hypothetical protein
VSLIHEWIKSQLQKYQIKERKINGCEKVKAKIPNKNKNANVFNWCKKVGKENELFCFSCRKVPFIDC